MRGGLLRTGSSWLPVSLVLGACSSIIGISDYEIDRSLDPPTAAGGEGGSAEAGSSSGGSDNPQGGQVGEAGENAGGSGGAGGAAEGGGAGSGAGGAAHCSEASDCDDEIECTSDACVNSQCAHTPVHSMCDADPGECVTCQLGIGCVATEPTPRELLLDKDFDEVTGDWDESIIDHPDQTFIVSYDVFAHTPENSAWWVPLTDPANAADQGYADLLQNIVIPDGTLELTLTGQYEVSAGLYAPSEDFVRAALFRLGATSPLYTFNDWVADDGDEVDWVSFSYTASFAAISGAIGDDLTFDLYGYNWDSSFYFDTLSLTASVCE